MSWWTGEESRDNAADEEESLRQAATELAAQLPRSSSSGSSIGKGRLKSPPPPGFPPGFDAKERQVLRQHSFERRRSKESLPSPKRTAYRTGLLVGSLAIGAWWWVEYFRLPKKSYNKVHPYTSFIPLACYTMLRNWTERLRRYYMLAFTWCDWPRLAAHHAWA